MLDKQNHKGAASALVGANRDQKIKLKKPGRFTLKIYKKKILWLKCFVYRTSGNNN